MTERGSQGPLVAQPVVGRASKLPDIRQEEATMNLMVTRQNTQVKVPHTSSAYFKAAGLFALLGAVLWIAEQE